MYDHVRVITRIKEWLKSGVLGTKSWRKNGLRQIAQYSQSGAQAGGRPGCSALGVK